MVSREILEAVVRGLAREVALPPEDWDAVLAQAGRVRDALDALDELPLDTVEPVAVYKVVP